MLSIKNQVQLIGRLGANPEIKNLINGKKLARFSIAVSDAYTNKEGERITTVQWHNVVAWGPLASIVETTLVKGTQVTIDGRLSRRHYINAAGQKIDATEILLTELLILKKPDKIAA
jgi:single-strand DNA-binding protein